MHLEPDLRAAHGALVNAVVLVAGRGTHVLGILPLSRQACRICTEDSCPDGVVALLQFEVQCIDDQVYLHQHSLGVIHPNRPAQLPFLTQVIELCAGIAATSQGAKQAGFVPTVAVEWRPPIHKLLQANFEGEALLAHITCPSTVAKIATACQGAQSLTAGVACQPYSRGGDGYKGQDQQAGTLP